MAKKNDEKKGLALIMLGIVSILAIAGLILLFRNSLSGHYAGGDGYTEYYTGKGPLGPIEAAPRRIGEPAPAILMAERLETQEEASTEAQKTI